MARKTKEDKRIDELANAAFKAHGNGVQVGIMDIGKVLDAGRDAAKAGGDVDEAVKAAFAKYRKN